MSTRNLAAALALAIAPCVANAAGVDVDAFTRNDQFQEIKLSPNGEYLAATVPFDDRTVLVVLDRASNKVLGKFQLGADTAIASFDWVNPTRVLIGAAERFGALDEPKPTGELFAMDASGGKTDILVGQRVKANIGSHIGTKKADMLAAFLVDDLPNDDKNVLISTSTFGGEPFTKVERMNVYSGQRQVIARAPVRKAQFVTDTQGAVRFAVGSDTDNFSKLYYRENDAAEWKLVNDERSSHVVQQPIGFAADGRTAYLWSEQAKGPDVILAYDATTGKSTTVLSDPDMSPAGILRHPGTSIPVGALYIDGKPRMRFFDEDSADARLFRSLGSAFGDGAAVITSATSDGRLDLVKTFADRNPGDYYLFDSMAKKADHVVSSAQWIDPAAMAPMAAIQFQSRDGLAIKGYLTVPKGASGKNMPMVVLPHGGPFDSRDNWQYTPEVQLLASAGYAVLQVNFRGSDNRGRWFAQAGARQWGGTMQDDVTDATRWAIQQGVADPSRICIYGSSYGAYAALEGVAKEPGLYKCAAGYVGVYDLPMIFSEGDTRELASGRTYLHDWIGEPSQVGAVSPVNQADRIKVPVFLAAGREDERAPVGHTERMESALKRAGVPVESLYFDGEGHGFYKPEHRREFYVRLLAFLSRSLGGATAAPATAAK
jgi:dipeptidyl aminopeptidase/acylaminoacyl peptidase